MRKVNALIVTNPDSLMEHSTDGSDRGMWNSHGTSQTDHVTDSISDLGNDLK